MTTTTPITTAAPLPADPKHLLVIGAGPGIGAGVARRFAREGFNVTLIARRADALATLATELEALGSTVNVISADAADVSSFQSTLTNLYALPDSPGVVVYNAVYGVEDGLLTSTAEHLAMTYGVDVISAVVTAQIAAPHLEAAGGGTILFTGGGLANAPYAGYATASLGKIALRAAATMLASDLAPASIHVASVTISGSVEYGTAFDPAHIGDAYWELHIQSRDEWTTELPFEGR